jgi:hypothetical protein
MTLEKIKNNSELVNKYNLYLAHVEIYKNLEAKHASVLRILTEQQHAEVEQTKQQLRQSIEELTTCSQFETTASLPEIEYLRDLLKEIGSGPTIEVTAQKNGGA